MVRIFGLVENFKGEVIRATQDMVGLKGAIFADGDGADTISQY